MTIYLSAQIASIQMQDYLNRSSTSYQKTMEQLSSGDRITSVGDDPVALTQSRKFDIEISGNNQASTNIGIGQDILNIADSTQQEVISSLQRIRDLCVQSSNETYISTDKDSVLDEIRQRLATINNMADTTNYNNVKLFNGSVTSLKIQTGLTSSNTIEIGPAFTDLHTNKLGEIVPADGGINIGAGVTGANWTTDDIHKYMDKIDTAITDLTHNCAISGGYMNRLSSTSDNLNTMTNNLTQSRSTIIDTDVAEASSDLVKYNILQEATTSILVQANQIPETVLSLLHGR